MSSCFILVILERTPKINSIKTKYLTYNAGLSAVCSLTCSSLYCFISHTSTAVCAPSLMRRSSEFVSVQVNSSVTTREEGWRWGGCIELPTRVPDLPALTVSAYTPKTHRVHLTQHVGHCEHVWRGEDHQTPSKKIKQLPPALIQHLFFWVFRFGIDRRKSTTHSRLSKKFHTLSDHVQ